MVRHRQQGCPLGLSTRPHLHQNRSEIETGQTSRANPTEKEYPHQQSDGLRAITFLPPLPEERDSDVSKDNQMPSRPEAQQVWCSRLCSEISISSFLVYHMPSIPDMADCILGAKYVSPKSHRIRHL